MVISNLAQVLSRCDAAVREGEGSYGVIFVRRFFHTRSVSSSKSCLFGLWGCDLLSIVRVRWEFVFTCIEIEPISYFSSADTHPTHTTTHVFHTLIPSAIYPRRESEGEPCASLGNLP